MRREYVMLALLFIVTAALRIYMALSTSSLSFEGYFAQRQVESILETGTPSFSGLGSSYVFLPFFYYILAGAALLAPLPLVLKILPNILASTVVIAAYLLTHEITRRRDASLFAAFAAGFVPVFMAETFNSVSVYALVAPLSFFLFYSFLNIGKRPYLYLFIGGLMALTFFHPSALLFVAGMVFYLALLKLERMKVPRPEIELTLFSALFVIWITFLVFKFPLLERGILPFLQNLPPLLLASRFFVFRPAEAISFLGFLPFLAGMYVIYRQFFAEKAKQLYLITGFAVLLLALLWLQLIEFVQGMIFLGIALTVLLGRFHQIFFAYVAQTKAASFSPLIAALFFAMLVLTSVVPSLMLMRGEVAAAPPQQVLGAFSWLANSTESSAVVLAPYEWGHLVTALGRRQNVIDSNILFSPDAGARFEGVRTVYAGVSKTDAVRIMTLYGVDYVISAEPVRAEAVPAYLEADNACFKKVYYQPPYIYRAVCEVS